VISIVPKADSFSGRFLYRLGRLLGLRSETVYSRAILLLALCQFIVLGAAVVLVWLVVTKQFVRADEKEMYAAAERLQDHLADHAGSAPQSALAAAARVMGREIRWRPVTPNVALGSVRMEHDQNGQEEAVFSVAGLNGQPVGEVVVGGARLFYNNGLPAARVFVVGLAVAGGLMLLVMLLVVDRTIVGRIQLLADKVDHEKKSERLPVRLDYPGDDELAMLARSMEELARLVQAAEREYRLVVEDQTESICRFNAAEEITFWNRPFTDLCRIPPSGKHTLLPSVLDPDLYSALHQAWKNLRPEKKAIFFTHAVSAKSGADVWYRSTVRANFDNAGNRTGGQWIAGEVTSEVVAQRKLQDSQRQLAGLSARLMTLQDEERRRLARELHDSTAQSLAALEINMSALIATNDAAEAKRLAEEAGEISRQVCDELRTISYLLHPPLLDEAGLAFAIRWLADGYTKRNSIPVFVDIPDKFPRLAPEVETALFRVVQESLSNIYRHAGATKAWITVGGEAGDIQLEVRDNGEGLPPNFSFERSSGVGLAGMRERMRELGGTLEVLSSEYGVLVKCRLKRSDVSRA